MMTNDAMLYVDVSLHTWYHQVPQFANAVLKLHVVHIPTSSRIHWHCCSAALQLSCWDPCDLSWLCWCVWFTWSNLDVLLWKAMSQCCHVFCLSQVSLGAYTIQASAWKINEHNRWTLDQDQACREIERFMDDYILRCSLFNLFVLFYVSITAPWLSPSQSQALNNLPLKSRVTAIPKKIKAKSY